MSINCNNLSSSICSIFQQLNIPSVFPNKESCDLKYAKYKCYELNSKEWKSELKNKTKLRTYVKLKDSYI